VKQLQLGGSVIIIYSAAQRTGISHHGIWPNNAVAWSGAGGVEGLSGKSYPFNQFTLKDGSIYYYFSTSNATPHGSPGIDWLELALSYTSPSGATGYYGEYYNYVVRGQTTDKVISSQLTAWLLAH
jgi:hypothetical protein